MLGRQKLIAIAQMILTKLPGRITLLFEQRRKGDILGPNTQIGSGYAHLGETCTDRRLTGDKG